MSMVGANPEELDALGQSMSQAAGRLSGIGGEISAMLSFTGWIGGDAEVFQELWHSNLNPGLATVGHALEAAGKRLHFEADQQRSASGITSGGSSGGPLGWFSSLLHGAETDGSNLLHGAENAGSNFFHWVEGGGSDVVHWIEGGAQSLVHFVEGIPGDVVNYVRGLWNGIVNSPWNPWAPVGIAVQASGYSAVLALAGKGISGGGTSGMTSNPYAPGNWDASRYMLQTYANEGIDDTADDSKTTSVSVVESSPGHYVVEIPGVTPFLPGGGVNNVENAGAGLFGDTDYSSAVEKIIMGLPPNSNVMLVGHSQGGIVAMDVANNQAVQSHVNVTNVLTFGSPISQMKDPPQGTQVLQLDNLADPVPDLGALGGSGGSTAGMAAPNWAYVPFYADPSRVWPVTVDAHNPVIYASQYQQSLSANDPSVAGFNASASAYDTTVVGPEGPNITTYNIATSSNKQPNEQYQPVN